jgi:hypothetical protein
MKSRKLTHLHHFLPHSGFDTSCLPLALPSFLNHAPFIIYAQNEKEQLVFEELDDLLTLAK